MAALRDPASAANLLAEDLTRLADHIRAHRQEAVQANLERQKETAELAVRTAALEAGELQQSSAMSEQLSRPEEDYNSFTKRTVVADAERVKRSIEEVGLAIRGEVGEKLTNFSNPSVEAEIKTRIEKWPDEKLR